MLRWISFWNLIPVLLLHIFLDGSLTCELDTNVRASMAMKMVPLRDQEYNLLGPSTAQITIIASNITLLCKFSHFYCFYTPISFCFIPLCLRTSVLLWVIPCSPNKDRQRTTKMVKNVKLYHLKLIRCYCTTTKLTQNLPSQTLIFGPNPKFSPPCMVQYWNGQNFGTKQNRNTNEVSFPVNFWVPIQVVRYSRTSRLCSKVKLYQPVTCV